MYSKISLYDALVGSAGFADSALTLKDGGACPEYYWTFSCADLDLAEFNVQKTAAKEMEQSGRNGNKYWRFTGSGGEFSKKELAPLDARP